MSHTYNIYLGVLEADKIKMRQMKNKMQKELYRIIGTALELYLNGRNMMEAIKVWAVSSVFYAAGMID